MNKGYSSLWEAKTLVMVMNRSYSSLREAYTRSDSNDYEDFNTTNIKKLPLWDSFVAYGLFLNWFL